MDVCLAHSCLFILLLFICCLVCEYNLLLLLLLLNNISGAGCSATNCAEEENKVCKDGACVCAAGYSETDDGTCEEGNHERRIVMNNRKSF